MANDLNNVEVKISLDGSACDFNSFELKQVMNSHHIFTVLLNCKNEEFKIWNINTIDQLEVLGKELVIMITDSQGARNEFRGIVKRVDMSGAYSNEGSIILYGGSPTLFMDDDYSMDSFTETDLTAIIQETLSTVNLNIEHTIMPSYNPVLPFVYRYKESTYDFINRLISVCGETFYYDGKKLIIGNDAIPKDDEIVKLSYKNDFKSMSIDSTLGSYNIEQYDYDSTRDLVVQGISSSESRKLNSFTKAALNISAEIHPNYKIVPANYPITQKTIDLMNNSVATTYLNKLSKGSTLHGVTTSAKIALGTVISVDIDDERKNIGEFRVIDIHHHLNGEGRYENIIVAVNSKVECFPYHGVNKPSAMPEVAVVNDNQDPRNMGRVKVQFMWQQLEEHPQGRTSEWLRVQYPHAGVSDDVTKDRGFLFIPEIGDQVMIGFEYGDPNRPFVMGSLYHANSTSGMAKNNMIKSIITQSGHAITFNDDKEGDWGITIKDVEGTTFFIDTKNKSVQISASENIQLTAKNVSINTEENIEFVAKGNILASSETDINIASKGNLSQQTDGNLSVLAEGDVNMRSTGDTVIKASNATLEGSAETVLKGAQTTVDGKMTSIQGAVNQIEII